MTSSPNHRRARVFAKGRGLFLVALALVALALLLAPAARAAAQADAATEPWAEADETRDALFAAQAALLGDDP
ncbi:MAG: hypothetical protein K1X50_02635, partial [Candidatus Promineofilum sp.]|nr:hypothetical protein [Promineifilum sp.]